jgi:hypothetical protein
LPQSYKAFGCIQPQNSLRGQRPKATIKNTKQTHYLTQKKPESPTSSSAARA